MALTQRYGIRYPFTLENDDELYLDLNNTKEESLKSRLLHVIFTPKGQRLRNPDFGTDLRRYIFETNNEDTWGKVKSEIRDQVSKYLPDVIFRDIAVSKDAETGDKVFLSITYSVKRGNLETENNVTVRLA